MIFIFGGVDVHLHIRGKSQSPLGTLARISTRPYLKLNDFFERNLVETIGGNTRFNPACRSHSCVGSINDVQLQWKEALNSYTFLERNDVIYPNELWPLLSIIDDKASRTNIILRESTFRYLIQ